ncbi:MAG: hypothetical protein NTW01_15530 [Gammaproteobacteria bacterium]|uniref:hypothetical protein n=1 Tax=Nevskia sp. TaxID=1929292 RepID=UPI0040370EA6|nr:hypothetical protein [Gammaproteobacteria bacterium]
MKTLPLLILALSAAAPARALDAACETFLRAAEKGVEQPSRHSVSEMKGGLRFESITVDGKSYSATGGKWAAMASDLKAAERKINAEIRQGGIKLDQCQVLGSETVDGIATTAIRYRMTMPGAPAAIATAYIGKDGLVYAQSSDDVRVRYRYRDVSAPKL